MRLSQLLTRLSLSTTLHQVLRNLLYLVIIHVLYNSYMYMYQWLHCASKQQPPTFILSSHALMDFCVWPVSTASSQRARSGRPPSTLLGDQEMLASGVGLDLPRPSSELSRTFVASHQPALL